MIALHSYLVDVHGKIFARITAFAEDEDGAEEIMNNLDDSAIAPETFDILEDLVAAPDTVELRRISEEQEPDGGEDDEPDEDEDLEEDEEESEEEE